MSREHKAHETEETLVSSDSITALARMVADREGKIRDLESRNAGLVEMNKVLAKVVSELTVQIQIRNSTQN